MEISDKHYFYNEEIIKNYLIKQGKFDLLRNIVNWKWILKETIWKDACDINDKIIEFKASSDGKKADKFDQSYDLIIGSTEKKYISGYKSLIWTLLGLLKAPEYEEYKNERKEQIRLTFDYKYMIEKQFWPWFIYKLDYLINKHRPDFDNNLITIEHIIDLINNWRIYDLQIKIDELTQDIIKRLAQERYNSSWQLIL